MLLQQNFVPNGVEEIKRTTLERPWSVHSQSFESIVKVNEDFVAQKFHHKRGYKDEEFSSYRICILNQHRLRTVSCNGFHF